MATMITGPMEGQRTQFRTQMINGKPQIYFDVLDESSPTKPPPTKRNSRPIANPTAARPPPAPPATVKPKSMQSNPSTKAKKKAGKVTFNDEPSKVGVFMTMEEISELVKAVKESGKNTPTITQVTKIEPPPEPPREAPQPMVAAPPPPSSHMEIPLQALAPISPRQEALGMMADKKRQKWMREKAEMDRMKLEVEYDQLKHQLSPHHPKVAPNNGRLERSGFPSDLSSMAKPPLPPSGKGYDQEQEPSTNDPFKTRLMEKKQQQWRTENAEKAPVWNPFGRPGAGAPNANEMPQRPNMGMPYRPPETVSAPVNIVLNDQTHVPAAMRTNLLFGDVRFDDDVRTAKEAERRQWLDDLRKQIEENKRQKVTQQETDRRHDFLQDNLQPLMQEAADRHAVPAPAPAPAQAPAPTPAPVNNLLTTGSNPPETKRSNQHDSIVQQTYKKILEATELAKYEKKAQLIEKLKRNGHKTDLLAKTLPEMESKPPQKPAEKVHEAPPKRPTQAPPPPATKVEPLHFNVGNDPMTSYRTNEGKRDEAVNTINSTFRSDNSAQTDFRMAPPRQMFSYMREESDLPPQVPNHLLRGSKNPQNQKTVRIRSLEDTSRQRRSSATTTTHSNNTTSKDDGALSQLGTNRSHYGPHDLVHRPLWNYHNPEHREYVPNSRRDPHYDKRQRQKSNEPGQMEDSPKRTNYNRWNSDGEIQQQQQQQQQRRPKEKQATSLERPRLAAPRSIYTKDETQMNPVPRVTKPTNQSIYVNVSSLDKYEHYIPYTRTDEVLDPARAFSPLPQSREPSAHKQRTEMPHPDAQRQRNNTSVQPPPYHVPPSRQDHILQQLSAIKENLVRRQQELTSSMNAIPV